MISNWTTAPAVLALAAVAACAGMTSGGDDNAGPGVLDALRSEGRADVIVSLTPPADYDDAPASAEVKAAIARLQDDVLAAVDSADFRLRHRFTSVPALTGTVYTERGLRLLVEDSRVVRVDLDTGAGTGGEVQP